MKYLPFYLLFLIACNNSEQKPNINPPKAKIIEKKLVKHGDERIDNYYWLNERENPEVISYLNEENAYTQAMMKPVKEFQGKLYDELKSRIVEDDNSVPYKNNGFWYQSKFVKGGEYPIYQRWKDGTKNIETLFNVNDMAKGYKYFRLGNYSVSEDNKMAAYSVDTVSRNIFYIRIKNVETGNLYPEVIENSAGYAVWANDNKTLYYTRKDNSLRDYQVWVHILGTDPKKDKLIFEEKDNLFSSYIYKTKSKKYLVIGSGATLSDEYRFIPADNPAANWKIFQKRERNLEYSFEHFGDYFYIRTNKDKATNFKLMKTPIDKTEKSNWKTVIEHNENILFENFEIFKNYLVVQERKDALLHLHIKGWNQNGKFTSDEYLPFGEAVYSAYTNVNLDFDSEDLRYVYTSMTTPTSTIQYNMRTKKKSILKEKQVAGGKFDKKNYVSERIWVQARDGKKIPVSIVRHIDTKLNEKTPLLQYGYGSYGNSMDPGFNRDVLSLLDRGFIYVLTHTRGGEDLGRSWYEDGKFLNKKNTFFDFIDVSKYLIQHKYTSPEHLYACGGSAGGLLMGAIVNYEPMLYKGVIASVPFVDVVTTMLDESIPLTTGEYDEWGNPNDKKYYDYIKSYSPYDNVEKKAYPNMLVTTGLHDSQVQYWEPAKWVAKLRANKIDKNVLLLHTNMDAGHGGASGRYESLKETAMEYAFLFMLEDIKK